MTWQLGANWQPVLTKRKVRKNEKGEGEGEWRKWINSEMKNIDAFFLFHFFPFT